MTKELIRCPREMFSRSSTMSNVRISGRSSSTHNGLHVTPAISPTCRTFTTAPSARSSPNTASRQSRNSISLSESTSQIRPRLSGGTFSNSRAFLPTLENQMSASCSTLFTAEFSLSFQNQPGRMETSTSAGIQCAPCTFPRCRVSAGGAPAPGQNPSVSSRLQLVSPAIPRSFPIQRQPGPTSLNMMAFGLRRRTTE